MTSYVPLNEETWEGDLPSRPLKVAVIREEFVVLTGNAFIAVVLNQLLYWTQRVKDFDLLLREERTLNPDCNVSPRYGWIYKSADELSEETMLLTTRPTMRKYLKFLVNQGWVYERFKPRHKWDKVTQYRVNLKKLQRDLHTLGYALPGYSLCPLHKTDNLSKNSLNSSHKDQKKQDVLNAPTNVKLSSSLVNEKNKGSREKIFPSMLKNLTSKEKNLTSYTYTEITSEINTKDHTERAREFQNNSVQEISEQEKPLQESENPPIPDSIQENGCKNLSEQAVIVWKKHIGQEVLTLTQKRKQKLCSLLNCYFKNNFHEWKGFCERIKTSPFLMGQGPNKWRVTFDWILEKNNTLKVLEGNFDSPDNIQYKQKAEDLEIKDVERRQLLSSIEDPTWKEWCTQLSEPNSLNYRNQYNQPISLLELKEIAQARFKEFDGRLVWIESKDQKALDRIEDQRLKLLSIVQRTFPEARNIRTQLEEEEKKTTLPFEASSFAQNSAKPSPKFCFSLKEITGTHPPSPSPLKAGALHAQ